MIIFGTRGITSVQQSGSFHCPACGSGAPFERKNVRNWFTLFFIPCIPLNNAADYLECKRCGGNFKPEVLAWNGTVPGQVPPPVPQAEEIHQLRPSIDPKTGMPLPPPPPVPQPYGASTVISYQSNGLATASMVLGILGLVTSFLLCPGFIFVPLSLLFGFIALGKVKKGNGLVGGKGVAMAGIACSVLAILVMAAMVVWVRDAKPGPDTTSKEPWRKAASQVVESSDRIAYGNTAAAQKLAEQYATTMAAMHELSFTSKKGRKVDSRYVVHCELTDGKCAFLVCVPDYRKFKGDTEDSLNTLAWSIARQTAISDGALPQDTSLCVALKGLVMFGSVMTGTVGSEEPLETNGDTDRISDYFPSTPPRATTPKGVTEAAAEEEVIETKEEE